MEDNRKFGEISLLKLRVNEDGTKAFLTLAQPCENETINLKEDIYELLNKEQISYGIDEQRINNLISNPVYDTEVMVAQGLDKEDGTDGYFEYLFDTTTNKKPLILEDGSVDYSAMMKVVTVAQGDKLAIYHPAIHGNSGIDVRGKEIKAVFGKEKSPLKGKGFVIEDDKCTYTALLTGKIELNDDRLMVTNVLEIKEDIDYLQGDIHFKGDLVIYGNVATGMVVEADGAITIRGNVEGATIIAGKDITLENGMQGGEKGTIISKGNVRGKFFEYAQIKAGAGIYANALLGCNAEAGTEVCIAGKRGIILGGITSAINRVEASNVGNEKEVKTKIYVGVPDTTLNSVMAINKRIEELQQRLSQIESATAMIDERDVAGQENPFAKQRMQLIRTKISTDAQISELSAQKYAFTDQIIRSRDSVCTVLQTVYPGTEVSIRGFTRLVEQSIMNVTFTRKGTEVIMTSN